jgi:outer membrane protein assembly factor BamB
MKVNGTKVALVACVFLAFVLIISGIWLSAANTTTRKATLLWKYGTGGHVQRTAVSDPYDSNDDFRIIAGSDDKNIYVFDASGGLLWQRQLEGKVWGASVSPNGRYFSAGTEGGNVYFFDGLGNLLWQNQLSNDAYETGVSRDGDYVVYGSMNWGDSTYSAYLFNKTGSLQWTRTAKDACGVAISDDGKSIVVGADNEFVFLYNASGEQVWKYKTGGEVWGVSMSGDASLVVAGSSDGYVYALDKSGKLVWKYDTGISVWEVSVSQDGQYVASSSEELVCFLSRNGNLIWQKTMASETEGIGLSENGDFLALGSYDGYVYSFSTR